MNVVLRIVEAIKTFLSWEFKGFHEIVGSMDGDVNRQDYNVVIFVMMHELQLFLDITSSPPTTEKVEDEIIDALDPTWDGIGR